MKNTITLTGLFGSQPLGFLAALGTLRILSARADVQLSWDQNSEPRAVLHVPNDWDTQKVLDELQTAATDSPSDRVFGFSDDIKVKPPAFRHVAREALTASSPDGHSDADWIAAWGSPLVTDQSKGNVKPTAFHMTAGRQQFLSMARELFAAWSPRADRKPPIKDSRFEEALFGPWRYADLQHAFGWDPANEPLHALRAKSPTKEKQTSPQGAVFLALNALPLFPTAAVQGRLQTTGFARVDQATVFSWPIWSSVQPISSVRLLLSAAALHTDAPEPHILHGRGISKVYRSVRGELGNKGLAILRPATVFYG